MFQAVWSVVLALAPWLLLGMAIAGVLHGILPAGFVRRQLGGRWGVPKAVALGVPLPLCSCGVIPAGLGLRKDGASRGATVGFLISTPQTGVDSILVSASFLGWPFAAFKLLSATVTGLVGGWIADRVDDEEEPRTIEEASADPGDSRGSLASMLEHSVEILRTIWRWIVFGVVVSAAIEVLVPDGFFTGLAEMGSLIPILAALVVSLPLYVCATASVPIAAALVAGGMPGGAALVFLIAGPATNVATIGAIYRALGRKTLAVYLMTIIGGSVVAGLLFDSVLSADAIVRQHTHGEATWWAIASAAVLTAMLLWMSIEDFRRWLSRRRAGTDLEAFEVAVEGMVCDGCTSRLERALRRLDGVATATVTLDPGRAVVRGAVDQATVLETVKREGFGVIGT